MHQIPVYESRNSASSLGPCSPDLSCRHVVMSGMSLVRHVPNRPCTACQPPRPCKPPPLQVAAQTLSSFLAGGNMRFALTSCSSSQQWSELQRNSYHATMTILQHGHKNVNTCSPNASEKASDGSGKLKAWRSVMGIGSLASRELQGAGLRTLQCPCLRISWGWSSCALGCSRGAICGLSEQNRSQQLQTAAERV